MDRKLTQAAAASAVAAAELAETIEAADCMPTAWHSRLQKQVAACWVAAADRCTLSRHVQQLWEICKAHGRKAIGLYSAQARLPCSALFGCSVLPAAEVPWVGHSNSSHTAIHAWVQGHGLPPSEFIHPSRVHLQLLFL